MQNSSEQNKINSKELGARIRELREKSCETQQKLADHIFTTQNYISKLEKGISFPSINTLLIIARHYNVSIDYLCTGNDKEDILAILDKYIKPVSIVTEKETDYLTVNINSNYLEYLVNTTKAKHNYNLPDNLLFDLIKHNQKVFYEKMSNDDEKFIISPQKLHWIR